MNEQPKNQIVIYETANQRVEVRLEGETVWLTQRQMAEVFDTTPENVLMHLKNIYHDGELEEAATTKDFLAVQLEGSRRVRRRLKHYNLDAIISVGYRVNSKRGVQFRIWATRVLRDHLLAGYTLNERRLAARGLAEAQQAVALLARTLTTHALVTDEGRAVLEVVQRYTRSWRLLLEYDEQRLADAPAHPVTPAAALSLPEARSAIDALRADLMRRGRASDLFGQERGARWPPSWAPSSRPTARTSRRTCPPPSARTTAKLSSNNGWATRWRGSTPRCPPRRGAGGRFPQAHPARRRADLIQRNRALHRLLVNGVTVEYRTREGQVRGAQARVIDFDDPMNDDWLVVNQFSVVENKHSRRPDVVLFVNGLPLAVVELKNAADEDATIWTAYQQLQTYQAEIPSLFASNAVLVVSDGVEARVGALGAGREWFKPWRTIGGGEGACRRHVGLRYTELARLCYQATRPARFNGRRSVARR